jgi:hypothetical protein
LNVTGKKALVAAALAVVWANAWSVAPGALTQRQDQPVVIELFQSQGCSSCPPAQDYLNRLSDRPDVLALSYGVTYWDSLGWKDTFASPQFTDRQRDYSARNSSDVIATPQFWINGRETVLGANPIRVAQLISKGGPGGPTLVVRENKLTVGEGNAPAGGADVWLVRYDSRTVQVAIDAGENKGLTLPHRDIVRALTRIGRWSGVPETIALPESAGSDLDAAVLVQAGRGGPILSAMKLSAQPRPGS